jgi:hypothetical protein
LIKINDYPEKYEPNLPFIANPKFDDIPIKDAVNNVYDSIKLADKTIKSTEDDLLTR